MASLPSLKRGFPSLCLTRRWPGSPVNGVYLYRQCPSHPVWRNPSFQCCPHFSISTIPIGKASSQVVIRLLFCVWGASPAHLQAAFRVGESAPRGISRCVPQGLKKVSSESELSLSQKRDDGRTVTELVHFIVLLEISEIALSSLLEPRKMTPAVCQRSGKLHHLRRQSSAMGAEFECCFNTFASLDRRWSCLTRWWSGPQIYRAGNSIMTEKRVSQ